MRYHDDGPAATIGLPDRASRAPRRRVVWRRHLEVPMAAASSDERRRRAAAGATVAVAAVLGLLSADAAARPAVIVEDIAGVPGVELLDTLEPGRVLELGTGGKVTLGYLASCEREVILGGRVMIGTLRSTVEGGRLRRGPSPCTTGTTAGGAGQGAAIVVRGGGTAPAEPASVTIRDPHPVFLVDAAAGPLTIEPAAGGAVLQTLPVTGRAVATAEPLAPGAYRARLGERSLLVTIEAGRARGVLDRLVAF
jgi:hypothetical protein